MRVLVVAGSSGGHIFPALALLECLKLKFPQADALLVLPRKNVSKVIEAKGFKIAYIDSVPLKAKIDYRNLVSIYKFFKGCWQSLIILLRFNPEVVVGFGSIASVPLVVLSWLMRIKVVLHEQNVIPGQANRFLANFCDRLAISFSQTREYFKFSSKKLVFTGNPLRRELIKVDKRKCREFFALEENKFTILVMGGSQGSRKINQDFLKALSFLPERDNLQVIHLAGSHDQPELSRDYSSLSVKSRVFAFLNEMEYALSLADLAVCRSGATSIVELIYYRLPAILLPYPFAYQHQMANARVLESKGAGIILEDKELDSNKLKNVLEEVLRDPRKLEEMRLAYDSFAQGDAACRLAELVMDANIGHACLPAGPPAGRAGRHKHYFFIGIGGIGMSGIAHLILKKGIKVSGADLKENKAMQELKSLGARIFVGHSAANIVGCDVVVYSSAIKTDNPELAAAYAANIPVIKRAQALAELMEDKTVVTVTGSHGKTTTTSLAAYLLLEAGLSPTMAIGGIFKNINHNASQGQGQYFVAEADESDGSFLYYHPQYSIITNIDYEHMDYYQTFESALAAYKKFINQTLPKGCLFCCSDDENLMNLVKNYSGRLVKFGLKNGSDIQARNIEFKGLATEFDVFRRDKFLARFHLALGGEHNVSNALSVVALGLELEISPFVIAKVLAGYKGAGRRLDIKFQDNDFTIIDDYAHHPTEIRATLAALKNTQPVRIVAVFQPHRYSRTQLLLEEFGKCFAQADVVVLTDIYPAGEPAIPGLTAQAVLEKIPLNFPDKEVLFALKEEIPALVKRLLKPGDTLVMLGAGDIIKVSDDVVEEFKKTR